MEALRKASGLLSKMPELKTEEVITWMEKGAGENFRLLCTLLKRNAIPTKRLNFQCKIMKHFWRKNYDE